MVRALALGDLFSLFIVIEKSSYHTDFVEYPILFIRINSRVMDYRVYEYENSHFGAVYRGGRIKLKMALPNHQQKINYSS